VAAQPARPTPFRPLPIAVAGAGVVALGVGAGFGGLAVAAHDEAAPGCATDGGGVLRCPAASCAALDRGRTDATVAAVLFVAGALGLGGGVALGLWGEGGPLSVGPGYIAVSGQF
jgi:hypothetical protein